MHTRLCINRAYLPRIVCYNSLVQIVLWLLSNILLPSRALTDSALWVKMQIGFQVRHQQHTSNAIYSPAFSNKPDCRHYSLTRKDLLSEKHIPLPLPPGPLECFLFRYLLSIPRTRRADRIPHGSILQLTIILWNTPILGSWTYSNLPSPYNPLSELCSCSHCRKGGRNSEKCPVQGHMSCKAHSQVGWTGSSGPSSVLFLPQHLPALSQACANLPPQKEHLKVLS